MLKCINLLPKHSGNKLLIFRLLTRPKHTSVNQNNNKTPAFFSSTEPTSAILTELVYGRKRIYTTLQSIGKSKASTTSRSCIASPITSSPLSWEWDQPAEDSHGNRPKKEWYQLKRNKGGASIINSFKQNLREMFLPVG